MCPNFDKWLCKKERESERERENIHLILILMPETFSIEWGVLFNL